MDPLFPDLGSSALLHSAQVRNHNVLGKLKWPGWHTTQHHVIPVGCEGWGGYGGFLYRSTKLWEKDI